MSEYPSHFNVEFDGSHAAPMLLSGDAADPDLVARQETLAKDFEALAQIELEALVGLESARFVGNCIKRRMAQREGLNSDSYKRRLYKHIPHLFIPGYSPFEVARARKLAMPGQSTPLQNHLARRANGMGTVENANLTTIGSARRYLREPMRDGIQELAGHDIDFGHTSAYRMKYLSSEIGEGGKGTPRIMRLSFKRRLSLLDDDAILKSRTTAMLNMSDRHAFDGDFVDLFREYYNEPNELSSLPEFKTIVENLIEGSIDPKLILAENETTYEVDERTIARIKETQEKKQMRKHFLRSLYVSKTDGNSEGADRFPVGDPRRQAIELYSTDESSL